MHELAVTESILEIAQRHAAQAGAARITDIYIVIGQLSSLVDDSVQFYWELISQDTLAAQSRLHFRRIPAQLKCLVCDSTYGLSKEELGCPQCGSAQVKILSGEEFYLEAIDVER